jgi:SAM-dependent methyltransferase
VPAALHYQGLAAGGITHGPAFQVLTEFRLGEGELLASYRTDQSAEGYLAHPVVTDGALQAGALLLAGLTGTALFLPAELRAVRLWHPPASEGHLHLRLTTATSREAVWDVTLTDRDGRVRMELEGCRLRRFDQHGGTPAALQELVLRAAPRGGAAPVRLPAPAELMTRTADARARLRDRIDDRYEEVTARTGEIAALFARRAVETLLPGSAEFGLDELCEAGALPKYRPYLRRLAATMCAFGVAERAAGERWRLTGRPAATDPLERIRSLLADLPESLTLTLPGLRCGLRLARLLRGEDDPREVLFAEADQHFLTQLYGNAPHLRLHNAHAGKLLGAMAEHWPADRPLRVLEVGAGTGGMTGALLPVLPPERTRYLFTDRSAGFLAKAKARFAAYDFVEYATFDLDRDPVDQGMRADQFDVVIAANALHTARDLAAAVDRLAGLLADGGMLLALESHDSDWVSTFFGVLDDYWDYTDTDLRRDSPLLTREQWKALLGSHGFDAVACTGEAPDVPRASDSVILARRAAAPAATCPPLATAPQPDGRWLVAAAPSDALSERLGPAARRSGLGRRGAVRTGLLRARRPAPGPRRPGLRPGRRHHARRLPRPGRGGRPRHLPGRLAVARPAPDRALPGPGTPSGTRGRRPLGARPHRRQRVPRDRGEDGLAGALGRHRPGRGAAPRRGARPRGGTGDRPDRRRPLRPPVHRGRAPGAPAERRVPAEPARPRHGPPPGLGTAGRPRPRGGRGAGRRAGRRPELP